MDEADSWDGFAHEHELEIYLAAITDELARRLERNTRKRQLWSLWCAMSAEDQAAFLAKVAAFEERAA